VLVQGDTTTAFASALAAFYEQIPVGHVEAGLRTDNLFDPFPEEANRRLISQVAQLHFAPTERSAANLRASGVIGEIITTGNTVIDALLLMARTAPDLPIEGLDWDRQRVLLATVHRRENWGERLEDIGRGFLAVLERFPDTALLLPMHRNPTVREPLQALLGDHPRAFLIEPLDYDKLVAAMRGCTLLLSDSGGIQEEAPALGKPVLVLRRTTERPEAVDAGTAKLIGTDSASILAETARLLEDPAAYEAMARAHNPFGDGQSSGRIVEAARRFLYPDPAGG
jgi:UDP-N-acetylglucosamine 2-epimerase (non-hydrolysing)